MTYSTVDAASVESSHRALSVNGIVVFHKAVVQAFRLELGGRQSEVEEGNKDEGEVMGEGN
jgi:hypothetical protein